MTESEIKNYAAILTAGLIARDHESEIDADKAADMFLAVTDAIRKRNETNISSNYDM